MRIQPRKYAIMRDGIKAVIDHYGGLDAFKAAMQARYPKINVNSVTAYLWAAFTIAADNMRYDDNHPFFQNGTWTRILPHNPNFDMYSDGDNDTHLTTALKAIGKEIGFAVQTPA
jgi:hypothetical protein